MVEERREHLVVGLQARALGGQPGGRSPQAPSGHSDGREVVTPGRCAHGDLDLMARARRQGQLVDSAARRDHQRCRIEAEVGDAHDVVEPAVREAYAAALALLGQGHAASFPVHAAHFEHVAKVGREDDLERHLTRQVVVTRDGE